MNSLEVKREIRNIRDMFAKMAEKEGGMGNGLYFEAVVQHLEKLLDKLEKYMDKKVSNYYTEAPRKVREALEAAEYARDRMGLRTFDVLDKATRHLK